MSLSLRFKLQCACLLVIGLVLFAETGLVAAQEEEIDQADVQLGAFIIAEYGRLGVPVPTTSDPARRSSMFVIPEWDGDIDDGVGQKRPRPNWPIDPEEAKLMPPTKRIKLEPTPPTTPTQRGVAFQTGRSQPNNPRVQTSTRPNGIPVTRPLAGGIKKPVVRRPVSALGSTRPRAIKAMIEMEAGSKAETHSSAGIIPAVQINTPRNARAAIRGGPFDPVGLAAVYTRVAGGLAAGRVTQVAFIAGGGFGAAPAIAAVARHWCDVAYNHRFVGGAYRTIAARQNRIPAEYQAGHLVAHRFGGISNDPLNFIPLHYLSNTNGGRWQKAEFTVASVRAAFTAVRNAAVAAGNAAAAAAALVCRNNINVLISLNYGNWPAGYPLAANPAAGVAANIWVPSDGTYRIGVTNVCYASLVARYAPVGAVAPTPTLARFLLAANVVVAGANTLMTITWRNRGDLPRLALPANPSPHYVVDAMLG